MNSEGTLMLLNAYCADPTEMDSIRSCKTIFRSKICRDD